MSEPIDKKTLEHLAELARLELDPKEEAKLLKDLVSILNYFKELQSLETGGVKPVSSGLWTKNAFREDGEREGTNKGKGTDAFPESENGFLKIPPLFSAEGGSAPGGE